MNGLNGIIPQVQLSCVGLNSERELPQNSVACNSIGKSWSLPVLHSWTGTNKADEKFSLCVSKYIDTTDKFGVISQQLSSHPIHDILWGCLFVALLASRPTVGPVQCGTDDRGVKQFCPRPRDQAEQSFFYLVRVVVILDVLAVVPVGTCQRGFIAQRLVLI